ncbi:MAG: hypothetical protein EP330_31230 [Deltaproteobacteria bacterium]|nr:MAG: hypothetical protein EP330_31230 [Deltaproteobacteria bacterium]
MLFLLCGLALAGLEDLDRPPVRGDIVRPDGAMLFPRHGGMSEERAAKVVRQRRRRLARTPTEKVELADALRALHDARFVELATRLDRGEDVDFTALESMVRTARDLYIDAAPGLPDDHAARALVLAAVIGEDLDIDPRPELETALELDPSGPFAAEARLRLAEQAFEHAAMREAAEGYEEVAAEPGRYQRYAAYKLAWCRYNLGDIGRALALIVPLAQEEGPLSGQAHRDAVLFAGWLDRPEALGVVDSLCEGNDACVEASALRLESYWAAGGR